MNIAQRLGLLTGGRSMAAIQNEILSEIDFHIDTLTDELVGQGWAPDDAKLEAEKRFGNRTKISEHCRSIQTGPMIWLTRASLVGLLCAGLVIGWLTYLLLHLRTQNEILAMTLELTTRSMTQASPLAVMANPEANVPSSAPMIATSQQNQTETLKGKITDAEGNPLENAKVVLIHKSWPNRKFQMENDVTKTDKDGNYVFEDLYSSGGMNEFLVTVFAEAYEMQSEYVSIKAKKKAKSIDFKLKAAKTITFQVIGEDKKPLADTDVSLMKRKTGKKEYMLYPISVSDAKMTTDSEGKIRISFLNENDLAGFVVMVNEEMVSVDVKVTKDDDQVIALVKK